MTISSYFQHPYPKMSSVGLKSNPLPEKGTDELPKIAVWLQSEEAKFCSPDGIVSMCDNSEGLLKATWTLMNQLVTNVMSSSSENRVSAAHFNKPAEIPIASGWMVYFMPVHVVSGTITVQGQELGLGHYCRFDENEKVRITGDFFALLLLCRQD
ncbi:hypothetical protein GGR52DRAFT_54611 [Hypoxylon sp. FL1284]|nr:hypothetical protein GGR52DRAFT_54611 [Hypoxylon sp. FL1284]